MEFLAWLIMGVKYYSHGFRIPLDFLGIKDLKKIDKNQKDSLVIS